MKNRPRNLNPQEINTQRRRIFRTYRSNSQSHFDYKTPNNFDRYINLHSFGENKKIDIRNQVPISHIRDSFIKSEYNSPTNKCGKTAFEKASIEEAIKTYTNKQKYQNLLSKHKMIKNICHKTNMTLKKKIESKKERLKIQLQRIISDALKFSKKNSAVRAMLPDNIDDIVAQAKKETKDISMSLNLSHVSRISRVSSIGYSILEKNEFLNSLGVDLENFNSNNINIDIDKCWNYVDKIAKGRKIEDVLRFKVVNTIMRVTEKKSSEKARKIYEKLEIYKKFMEAKKKEEQKRKRIEDAKKEKILKNNIDQYIKNRIRKSVTEKKIFIPEDKYAFSFNKKNNLKKNKKMKRIASAGNIKTETKKKFKRLNAYNDVSKIITFIDKSNMNSQSKICRNHYDNIKITKNMDTVKERLLIKNDIFS